MDWKKKTILYYTLGGMVIGILAGKNQKVELSLKNGAKIGIAALDVVKKNRYEIKCPEKVIILHT